MGWCIIGGILRLFFLAKCVVWSGTWWVACSVFFFWAKFVVLLLCGSTWFMGFSIFFFYAKCVVLPLWSGMRLPRLLDSLKLLVSFAKEPYKRDDILQKRPVILRSLLIVATPYLISELFNFSISFTAQEWINRTLSVHVRVDSRFLVLPGSESTITQITDYMYFSPFKPCREFKYKSD